MRSPGLSAGIAPHELVRMADGRKCMGISLSVTSILSLRKHIRFDRVVQCNDMDFQLTGYLMRDTVRVVMVLFYKTESRERWMTILSW